MSMQNYLKKANKKLVADPETETTPEGEHHNAPVPGSKGGSHSKQSGGSVHNAPALAKKGTRKKI